MCATSGAGTAYPKEAHEFTPGFCEIHVAQSGFLCSVLLVIICPLSFRMKTSNNETVFRYKFLLFFNVK
jgi:hypothetical protein